MYKDMAQRKGEARRRDSRRGRRDGADQSRITHPLTILEHRGLRWTLHDECISLIVNPMQLHYEEEHTAERRRRA